MKEIINSIDIETLLLTIWTAVILPVLTHIGTQVYNYLELQKLDNYTAILFDEVKKAVACVYEIEVKDIKGTPFWTEDKKREVKELAKTKTIQALSSATYRCLKEANSDFEEYLDSLIGTALYDLKNTK